MSRHLLLGVLVGALAGFLVFCVDLGITAITFGHRFDATANTYVLLAVLAGACVVVGSLVGLVAGPVLFRANLPRWLLPLGIPLLAGAYFALTLATPPNAGRPAGVSARSAAPRDVLWIVVDTLRADFLYGTLAAGADDPERGLGAVDAFPDAPHLSRLAEDATVFTEAEAPSGWTLPSTAALLTGIGPGRLGARQGLLPRGADTAAELLRAAGWQTSAHIDNTLLDESNGFAAGFQRFEKQSPMDFGWKLRTSALLPARLAEELRHGLQISYSGAERLVDRAIEDLESAGDQPLFLYVHAMDVHAPYWSELEDDTLAEAAASLPGLDGTGRDAARKDAGFLAPVQKEAIRALYRAELAHVDEHVGRLLARFDELRGLDDALVVVTSDHGEEFWEHGKMGHGHALWGEVVRVPLILRVPDELAVDTPGLVSAPVSLVDVLPTVADLLGLAPAGEPFDFDGRSLAPLLRREPFESVPLHAEQFRFNRTIHRWRDGDLVLVHAQLPDDRERLSLFDVAADPHEAEDLAGTRPDDLARMRRDLQAYLDDIHRGSIRKGDAVRNESGLEDLGY